MAGIPPVSYLDLAGILQAMYWEIQDSREHAGIPPCKLLGSEDGSCIFVACVPETATVPSGVSVYVPLGVLYLFPQVVLENTPGGTHTMEKAYPAL